MRSCLEAYIDISCCHAMCLKLSPNMASGVGCLQGELASQPASSSSFLGALESARLRGTTKGKCGPSKSSDGVAGVARYMYLCSCGQTALHTALCLSPYLVACGHALHFPTTCAVCVYLPSSRQAAAPPRRAYLSGRAGRIRQWKMRWLI